MYSQAARRQALALLDAGLSVSQVSRHSGISRAAIAAWRDRGVVPRRPSECFRCHGSALPRPEYAALLGYYLGDGCLSSHPRYHSLRVSCDASRPGIIRDVTNLLHGVRPHGRVHHVSAPGVVVVQANWKHWPCLFPQHGPGRKHERPIVLEDWQRTVVEAHPADFLRGLFHSDGCRVHNWTRRSVGGEWRRYDYPRWQFSNRSDDILGLCCWSLDLVGVPWRRSNRWTVSVSRREAVARLDELVGPKT